MGRAPCCEKIGLKRGPWTPEEDQKLVSFINEHGHGSWRALPKKAGLLRCGKSCRLRWTNYLRPDIKRGEFSTSEEHAILQLHALLGNRWSAIASHLPKRTDNEIKNYWNTHLKKRLVKMGLDPVTHKPLSDGVLMSNSSGGTLVVRSSDSEQDKPPELGVDSRGCAIGHGARDRLKANVKDKDDDTTRVLREVVAATKGSPLTTHLMQWESVRLEAEARLTQEAQMRAKGVWRRELQRSFHSGPATLLKMADSLPTPTGKQRSVGALKAVSAVEIINTLHNWEKSLQGQAGALWPDSWKLAAAGANTNQFSSCGHSESSSSSSPLAADHTLSASASAPSSTTSVEPRKLSGSERVAASSPGHPRSPPRKLSWNDAPRPPSVCFKGPDAPPLESGIGSRPCGSFSSLMLDAVLGRSLVQAPRMVPLIASHLKDTSDEGNSDVQLEGESADADNDFHPIEASIDVSAVTGDVQEVGEQACTVEDAHVEDDDEMSADGTSDLFKDLPRLKKKDVTTAPVSYTAMLSEEISDYWSNMVLKEQVSSPTPHMAF